MDELPHLIGDSSNFLLSLAIDEWCAHMQEHIHFQFCLPTQFDLYFRNY